MARHDAAAEEQRYLALREALENNDPAQVLRLSPTGCGHGFLAYRPSCLLTELCSDAGWRTPDLVQALLDGGHSPEGLTEHNPEFCPLSEVLAQPGHHDLTLVNLLLARGARLDRAVAYDHTAPDIDEHVPVWVQGLRTGRVDYLEAMLASGWQPEAWRTWDHLPEHGLRTDPLDALWQAVEWGPWRQRPLAGTREETEAHALQALHLLTSHGFNAAASDVSARAKQTAWYQSWERQQAHQHLATHLPEGCPPVFRPRL